VALEERKMKTSQEEFFQALDLLKKHNCTHLWVTEVRHGLRLEAIAGNTGLRRHRHYSPITAVCRICTGKQFGLRQWPEASRALGMHPAFAAALARAQDNMFSRLKTAGQRKYRRQLCVLFDFSTSFIL